MDPSIYSFIFCYTVHKVIISKAIPIPDTHSSSLVSFFIRVILSLLFWVGFIFCQFS